MSAVEAEGFGPATSKSQISTRAVSQAVVIEGSAWQVHIEVFDGPLDLLLHLIRKEELDIFDIEISRLTTAYLESLEQMRRAGIDPASEFLVTAATLLQIKSRMLLPRPADLDDIEAEDPRTELMRQLLDYQRFKEVAQDLRGRPRQGWDCFLRPGGQDRPPSEDAGELGNQDVFRLAEAFRRLVDAGRFEASCDIYVERISIAERIAQIADALAGIEPVTFASLCTEARYREEIITTFLALLEMARLKLIAVTQADRLGELYLEARVKDIDEAGERAAGTLIE